MIKSKNQFEYLVIKIDSDLNFNSYTENPKKKKHAACSISCTRFYHYHKLDKFMKFMFIM